MIRNINVASKFGVLWLPVDDPLLRRPQLIAGNQLLE